MNEYPYAAVEQWRGAPEICVREGYLIRTELKDLGGTYSPTAKTWVFPGASKATLAQVAAVIRRNEGDPTLIDRALREGGLSALADEIDPATGLLDTSYQRDRDFITPASEPDDDLMHFPLDLFPYQRVGARFARERRGSLIADEMGAGKTITALAAAALDDRIAVICPAVVKTHWKHQSQIALATDHIVVVNGTKPVDIPADTRVVIVNYDIFPSHALNLTLWRPTTVILDEAHMVKNPKTKRTKAIKTFIDDTEPRVIALSGTPLMNRPVELIPILQMTGAFEDIGGSWMNYVKTFCRAKKTKWGWDVNGASNLDLLAQRLSDTIMIRRTKADVLPELPPKIRRVVELDLQESLKAYRQAENEAAEAFQARVSELMAQQEMTAAKAIKAASQEPEGAAQIAELRREVGMAKLDVSAGFIIEHLESTGRKAVVFVHHKDVRAGMKARLTEAGYTVVEIGGDSSPAERDDAVEAFQNDPDVKVFLGSTAASVGITLTAASDVFIVEQQWTPAILDQSEDRVARIGQTASSVTAWHLLAPECAVDVHMWQTVERKRRITAHTLGDPLAQAAVRSGGRGAAGYVAALLAKRGTVVPEVELDEVTDE